MKPEIKKRLEMIRRGEVPAGYKKTKVGIIPITWNENIIGDLGKIKSGSTPLRTRKEFYESGNIPWIKTLDLNNGYIERTDEKITERAIKETSCYLLPKYSVLIAMYGGFNQIGRTGINTFEAATNQAISALIPEKDRYLSKYILEWLNFKVDYWKKTAASSRKDPNITKSDIEKFPIIIPKFDEQKIIIEILSIWDKAIEKQEKLIELKKEQKKGLAHKLLMRKLTLQNRVSNVKKVKLKEYIKESTERNKENKISRILSVTNNRGFIEQSEQFERQVASKDITGYKVIKKNKFGYNPSRINVGSLDLLKNYDEGVLSPIYVIFEAVEGKLLTQYLYQFLKSDEFSGQLRNLLQGSVRNNLSFHSLEDVKLYIPGLNEQKAIAEILMTADKEIELLEKELDMVKEQKKGLMELLLTGIIRV